MLSRTISVQNVCGEALLIGQFCIFLAKFIYRPDACRDYLFYFTKY